MIDRVTVPEAAKRLNISEGAIRQRIHRGTLHADRDETGRVYVSLTPEDTQNIHVKTTEYDESDTGLLDELRDRIRFLEEELADRKEENRRKDAILMTLAQRVPELEAADPDLSKTETSRASTEPAGTDEGKGTVPPEPKTQSWWRRLFAS